MERSIVTGKTSKQKAISKKQFVATNMQKPGFTAVSVFVAALPSDVRKGFPFPIAFLPGFLRGYASRRRHSLHLSIKAGRKAGGFPHIKRRSRELSPAVLQPPASLTAAGFTLLELMI